MEQVLALGLKAMLCWVSLALENGSSVSKGMKHLVAGGVRVLVIRPCPL